jgi:hypothetical protein
MYIHIALSIVLSAVAISADSDAVDLAGVNARNEERIAEAMPVEFAEYRKRLAGDGGPNDANETILLIKKAKACLLSHEPNLPKESEWIDTYVTAWQLCLRRYEAAADAETRASVLDAWNHELKLDDEAVPFQIRAILHPSWWNRAFLTEDFWALLDHSRNPKTIKAIATVLAYQGDATDEERLLTELNRLSSDVDVGVFVQLEQAINYVDAQLRLGHSPSGILGPALDTTRIKDPETTSLSPKQLAGLGRRCLPFAIKRMGKGDMKLAREVFSTTRKQFEGDVPRASVFGSQENVGYTKMVLEWWPIARNQTPRQFSILYERWKGLKDASGGEDQIREVLRRMGDLGIAVLPAAMDKIAHGDDELIPFVSSMVGSTGIDRRASYAQCLSWWERNKREWLIPFPNGRPIAKAGADQVVGSGDAVKLDGSASTDPDGDELSFEWTQLSGPTVTLSDAANAAPTFTAPEVEQQTILEFRLVVDDAGDLSKAVPTPNSKSEPVVVKVTVNPRK